MDQIDLTKIMGLKDAFDQADIDKEGSLDIEEFAAAFGGLNEGKSQTQITRLFMKIDADAGGTIDWKEFMNYILLENETLSNMNAENFRYVKSNIDDPSPNQTSRCHQDMITCMIVLYPDMKGNSKFVAKNADQNKTYTNEDIKKKIQYATSGRDGNIKIWNSAMKIKTVVDVGKYWVTGITYMTRSRILVAACADRTIKFYDLNSNTSSNTLINTITQPVSVIAELDGVPLCLDYVDQKETGNEIILCGDDLGIAHMYTMSKGWHICQGKFRHKKANGTDVYDCNENHDKEVNDRIFNMMEAESEKVKKTKK